jgi:hypothetical protein
MPRQSDLVREASAQRVRRLVDRVNATLPEAHRTSASVITGTLVGSLQLARALGNTAEGRALLAGSRQALLQQYDTLSPVSPASAATAAASTRTSP